MIAELSPRGGGLRAALDERVWAGAVARVGVSLSTGPAPIDSEETETSVEVGPSLTAAVVLLEHAPIRFTVLSRPGPQRGLLGLVATDGRDCASVVRPVVQGESGRLGLVPGVEVGAGGASDCVAEVLRLLPRSGSEAEGDATVVLEQPARPTSLLRLMSGPVGWEAISLDDDGGRHRPFATDVVRQVLSHRLAEAVARLVSLA